MPNCILSSQKSIIWRQKPVSPPPDTKHNTLHINTIQTENPIILRCDARTLPHVRPPFPRPAVRMRGVYPDTAPPSPEKPSEDTFPSRPKPEIGGSAGNASATRPTPGRTVPTPDTTRPSSGPFPDPALPPERPKAGNRAANLQKRREFSIFRIRKDQSRYTYFYYEKNLPADRRHFGGTLRRGAMAARRRPHQNRLGRESRPAERPARIPAPAVGPRRVAEPQRPVELRDPSAGRNARRIRRRDSRAVRRGVGALGRGPVPRRRERPLVRTDLLRSGEMARQTGAAARRRRGLEDRRLGERHRRRLAHGRLHPLRVRHHRSPGEKRQHPPRPGLGPHREELPAARQTVRQTRRHLVLVRERHLADRMARSRAAAVHPRGADDARPRPETVPRRSAPLGGGSRRPRRSRALRRGDAGGRRPRAQRRPRGAVRGGAEALEPRHALPLRPEGDAAPRRPHRGPGAQLYGDAQILDRTRPPQRPAADAQRQAPLPVRPARSGLVARRALHGPDGRGAGLRRREDQGAGLQHDPQARESRAGTLVLPLRQGGHHRLAGHAQRRHHPRLAPLADEPVLHGRGEAAVARIRSLLPQGVARDHRLPPSVRLDRRVGSLQRDVGPVQDARNRRVDQGLRPDAPRERRQRRQPLPGGRHARPAQLPHARAAALRHRPRIGAGRIRRHRPGRRRPPLGEGPQLGLRTLQLAARSDRRVRKVRRGAAPPPALLLGGGLYADLRRRDRGERPDDLRPQGDEGRAGTHPGDQPQGLQRTERIPASRPVREPTTRKR